MAKKIANKKKHLRKEERFCIEQMIKAGKSFGDIGRTLGRGISTISEEVRANKGRLRYQAERAHQRAYWKQYRKKRECNKVAMSGALTRAVERELCTGRSPETIAAQLKRRNTIGTPSPKSIRKFIGRRPGLERFLFWERNAKKSGRKRRADVFLSDPGRKSIDLRPQEAKTNYGHWEGDFIVSAWNTWVLLVLVEKYSKTVRLALLPNRTNALVNGTIARLLFGHTVKSLTLDNDIAFRDWRGLELALGAPIYFCHPFHSWEKGLVENTNRWLREFIAKKSDLARYTVAYINWVEQWFNHGARVCLSGQSPYEILMEKECGKFVSSLSINLPTLRIWG